MITRGNQKTVLKLVIPSEEYDFDVCMRNLDDVTHNILKIDVDEDFANIIVEISNTIAFEHKTAVFQLYEYYNYSEIEDIITYVYEGDEVISQLMKLFPKSKIKSRVLMPISTD